MAVGAWFTSIVNLYSPYQIMKELYVETVKFLKKSNETIEDMSYGFLSLNGEPYGLKMVY